MRFTTLFTTVLLFTTALSTNASNFFGSASSGGGGSGTVTSVGLALPAFLTVSGSPVTTVGTLTGTLAVQNANKVFAGPASGGDAAPTFRLLDPLDIPALSYVSSISVTAPIASTGGLTPTISCVVATGSVAGCLSAADWTTFNGKQAAGNYITALTGDVTASGPGSAAATLATVNSNVGSFGGATTSGTFTVNGKGLITAASSTSIQIAESQVTNLTTDLAAKQVGPLTGDATTLAANNASVTIAANAITNAKLAQAPTLTMKGNNTGGTANVADLTVSQVNTMLGASLTSSYDLVNLSISSSVGSSALTINLLDASGATPSGSSAVGIGFRNSTLATGTYNIRSVTGALSLVISSGSTMGFTSAVADNVYVYAIDNAGTVELAASTALYIDPGVLVSTTAEGGAGAADSRTVIYSTTARTSVPIRLIGRLTLTEATAGTWATNSSAIAVSPFGSNNVGSSSTTLERIERVYFGGGSQPSNCTTGACTLYTSTPGIASVTWNSTGTYTIAFTSGTFSTAPSCTGSTKAIGAANTFFSIEESPGPSTSSVKFSSVRTTNVGADSFGMIICMGAH